MPTTKDVTTKTYIINTNLDTATEETGYIDGIWFDAYQLRIWNENDISLYHYGELIKEASPKNFGLGSDAVRAITRGLSYIVNNYYYNTFSFDAKPNISLSANREGLSINLVDVNFWSFGDLIRYGNYAGYFPFKKITYGYGITVDFSSLKAAFEMALIIALVAALIITMLVAPETSPVAVPAITALLNAVGA